MKTIFLVFTCLLGLCSIIRAEDPPKTENKTDTLVLGAGCFWCVEAIYERVPGVTNVVSGYAGGTKENPTYEEVCAENTGHAEVVEITFDPAKTNVTELLTWFWKNHDPTNPNGVEPDFGPSYRSIILYKDEEQKKAIEASKAVASKKYTKPIATEIAPLKKFWIAEAKHQNFVKENPNQGYVRRVSIPRIKETGLKP